MVHAFHTDPLAPAATTNGTEAWAFVPPSVMDNLVFDYTNNSATAWPDGSGTLATAKINGVYKSVLVMGEGNGGSSVFALDVTETVQTNGTVVGPTLLWTFNDANMGLTSSKPVVIRTKIGTTETWLAVFSSVRAPAVTSATASTPST
jgi:type IV pilus assembly protein PilY1